MPVTQLVPQRRRRRANVTVKLRLKSPEGLVNAMAQQPIGVRALAAKAGVSRSFISQLRCGQRPGCTPAVAQRLAENLKVEVAFLFAAEVSTTSGRTSSSPRMRGAA